MYSNSTLKCIASPPERGWDANSELCTEIHEKGLATGSESQHSEAYGIYLGIRRL